MSGTKAGGLKAREKNLERDPDFYKKIGQKGGRNGKGPNYKGGFAANKELAKIAGAKGGRKSRRVSKHAQVFEENKEAIDRTVEGRTSFKELAKALGVPYASLTHYIKKHKG